MICHLVTAEHACMQKLAQACNSAAKAALHTVSGSMVPKSLFKFMLHGQICSQKSLESFLAFGGYEPSSMRSCFNRLNILWKNAGTRY